LAAVCFFRVVDGRRDAGGRPGDDAIREKRMVGIAYARSGGADCAAAGEHRRRFLDAISIPDYGRPSHAAAVSAQRGKRGGDAHKTEGVDGGQSGAAEDHRGNHAANRKADGNDYGFAEQTGGDTGDGGRARQAGSGSATERPVGAAVSGDADRRIATTDDTNGGIAKELCAAALGIAGRTGLRLAAAGICVPVVAAATGLADEGGGVGAAAEQPHFADAGSGTTAAGAGFA